VLVSGSRETWIGSWGGGSGEAKGARTGGASATLWKAQEGKGELTGELQLGVHVGSSGEEEEEEEERGKFRNKLGRHAAST